MDKLESMTTFVQVYRSRNFGNVARQQGVTPAVVTRRITALEKELGSRLFHRTTRKVQPTDIGSRYFEFCSRILSEIEAGENEVHAGQREPRGELRVSVPKAFGVLHIGRAAADFIRMYPGIRLSIVNDAPRDATRMLEDGIDLAFRMSRPKDSGMMARRICQIPSFAYASPDYLARCGTIRTPADLLKVNCLQHEGALDKPEWNFSKGRSRTAVRVDGNCSSNSTLILLSCAVDGLGVGLFPDYVVAREIASGRLERVLPTYRGPDHELFIIFPYRQYVPKKIRLFIDFMIGRFRGDDWQSSGVA